MPRLQTSRNVLVGFPATPEAMLAQLQRRAEARGRPVVENPETLEPYVQHGWWIADCPNCNAGISIHPEWPVAGCRGCFHVYRAFTLPREWRDIERVLAQRPEKDQHWWSSGVRTRMVTGHVRPDVVLPAETVDQLRAENASRGLPDGRDGRGR